MSKKHLILVAPSLNQMGDKSYEICNKTQRQQHYIASVRDADPLKSTLSRLPSLNRVTVNTVAHEIHGRPLYATPALGSLSQVLICPLGRGWPATCSSEDDTKPWDSIIHLDQQEKQ